MAMRRKPTRLKETKKRDILGAIARKEMSVLDAAAKYNVATSAIYRWQKQYGFKIPQASQRKTAKTIDEPVHNVILSKDDSEKITFGHISETAGMSAAERLLFEYRVRKLERENTRLKDIVGHLTELISEYIQDGE